MSGADRVVSVIVPVWNGEPFLAEALASIAAQAHAPLDIVVVDDGSSDGTAAVARRFGAGVRYAYQDNAGPAAAKNTGLALARGELVTFLDADDLWPVDKLARQVARLAHDPGVDLVMGLTQVVWASSETRAGWAARGVVLPDTPVLGPCLGSALIRRPVFERVGVFDPALRMGEDFDWFMRVKEAGVTVAVVDQVALIARRHASNMTWDLPSTDHG